MTKLFTALLLTVGLFGGAAMLPDSQAHEGHEGHDHGSAQEAPQQVAPSEPSPGVMSTPPPFETLDNESANSPANPDRSYAREQAPSTRDWGQPYDRRFETSEPPATPRMEAGDRPRLQAPPRTFEQYPRDRQMEPRTYEDVRPQASPPTGRDCGCPLDAPNVGGYSSRLLPSDTWSCPQQSDYGLSAGLYDQYHYSDALNCHANEVVQSHYFGDHDHSYSYGY